MTPRGTRARACAAAERGGPAILRGSAIFGGPAIFAIFLALAAAGCVNNRHPLANDGGNISIVLDPGPLFAADVLDADGVPVLPRQEPYEKRVQLYLTQNNAPDRGAFVDMAIDPPQALQLVATDASCEQLAGAFRCTAADDGYASFLLRSESDYSGPVTLGVVDRPTAVKDLTVSPAGLPAGATDFQLIVNDVAGNRVPAKFDKLATEFCRLDAAPDMPGQRWPPGKTRMRGAQVRASAPGTNPGSLDHAPIYVETLHPEAFVTLDPSCPPPHNSRLRVQLDAAGNSPDFFFCFSDVGGANVQLQASSGGQTVQQALAVDAEPYLLRVRTVPAANVPVNPNAQFVALALSGYDSDLNRIAFDVDIGTSVKGIVQLPVLTVKLISKDQGDMDLLYNATAIAPGQVSFNVAPALHATPSCPSDLINVVSQ